MTFHSVAEIFDFIERAHRRFAERVESLGDEQARRRPSPERWSPAEIVEHVSIVEGNLLRLTHKLLKQAEAAGRSASPDLRVGPVSLAPVLEDLGEKFQAPMTTHPAGAASIAESLAKMRETQEGLFALRQRLEATDVSAVSFPHPAAGPLNLYQWLVLIGTHAERHLAQIVAAVPPPTVASPRLRVET